MSQVLAALIGALVAGAAGGLAALVASRRTAQHWRRDARLRAYTAVLQACEAAIIHGVTDRTDARAGIPVREGTRDTWVARIGELAPAVAEVQLLGPEPMGQLARDLQRHARDQSMVEPKTTQAAYAAARAAFVDRGIKVLGTDRL